MRTLTLVLTAGLLLLLAAPAIAEEDKVLIDFETFPDDSTIADGTRITDQFAPLGVSFFMTTDPDGPQIVQFDLDGQSGDNALGGDGGTFDFFQPISAVFAGPTDCVSITALDVGENGLILEAFLGDTLVDSDKVEGEDRGVGVGEVDVLTVSAAAISRIVIRQLRPGEIGDGYVIDDFEFTEPNVDPNNREVFLILSLEEEFDTPTESECEEGDNGSDTYVIRIGTFVAGEEIPNTRFDILATLADIELPDGLELEDLDGYQFTILGTFDTFNENSIHLVSPTDDDIPVEVQEAFFVASPFLESMPGYPVVSTVETAQFIWEIATGFGVTDESGEPVEFQEILDHIYITNDDLTCTDCQAEGDMFPHDPDATEPLFGFDFEIDEDTGSLAVDVFLLVDVDIKPGSTKNPLNLKSKGVLPVAILTTDSFDAVDQIDTDTATLNGAALDKYSVEDVDDDGDDDLLLKFKVQDLVDAGVDEDTEELEFRAKTNDGRTAGGTDTVTIPPPGKSTGKGKKK